MSNSGKILTLLSKNAKISLLLKTTASNLLGFVEKSSEKTLEITPDFNDEDKSVNNGELVDDEIDDFNDFDNQEKTLIGNEGLESEDATVENITDDQTEEYEDEDEDDYDDEYDDEEEDDDEDDMDDDEDDENDYEDEEEYDEENDYEYDDNKN